MILDDYEVVIRRKDGFILARIPSLNLERQAPTIEDALAALAQACAPANAAANLRAASSPVSRGPSDIKRFAIKSGILTAMIVLGGLILSFQLAAVLDNALFTLQKNMSSVGGRQFWSKIDQELARAADPKNDMPADRKERMLVNLSILVDRWHPFIAEIERAFTAPVSPEPEAKSGTAK